jgi:hypothetical protein
VIEITNIRIDTHAITGEVRTKDNNRWWVATMYVPQSVEEKIAFLTELVERRSLCPGSWMVVGDFNMILYADEKNNDNLDRAMMARFRSWN